MMSLRGSGAFWGNTSPLYFCFSTRFLMFEAYQGMQPNRHSYIITPNDQTSAFEVYYLPSKTSGAMYAGLPIKELVVWWGFSCLLKPQSATFAMPFFMRILAGLMSLCSIFFLSAYVQALTICWKIGIRWLVSSGRQSWSVPPSHS